MRTSLIVVVLVASALVVGCEKKSEVNPAMTEPPPAPPAAQPLPPAPPLDNRETRIPPTPPLPAEPPVVNPPETGDTRTYTVQARETLWSIAKQQLGDGKRWKDITALNPGLTPENLKAGQTIKLPAK